MKKEIIIAVVAALLGYLGSFFAMYYMHGVKIARIESDIQAIVTNKIGHIQDRLDEIVDLLEGSFPGLDSDHIVQELLAKVRPILKGEVEAQLEAHFDKGNNILE